jgi:hypothetical protein
MKYVSNIILIFLNSISKQLLACNGKYITGPTGAPKAHYLSSGIVNQAKCSLNAPGGKIPYFMLGGGDDFHQKFNTKSYLISNRFTI